MPPGSLAPSPSPQHVSAVVHEVLERPRYARFRVDAFDPWKEVLEAVREFLNWLRDLQQADPTLFAMLTAGLLLVACLLTAHVVWTLRAALRPALKPPAAHSPMERDFEAEAAALAAQGEYLDACHLLLLSALRVLARTRKLVLRPDHTNAQVCRDLAQTALAPALRRELVELIQHTEQRWFGGGTADAAMVAAWQRALWKLRSGGGPADSSASTEDPA